ncbi:DUF1573 domain-containing protein [Rubrolithibacter danxiaensis]|uniref:DUF1573 domain-containing protein n=1 Tax=Rubrolithibacter danxiaensis TaxID=3390805 RepID=UPI003BF88120
MKKILMLFSVILSFTLMTALKADNQPEFKFETETHDFGKIPQGKPVSYEFKFTNVGDQPLIISAVEPTCGCTVADYTKTPVKKGEAGNIKLTFNAAVASSFTKAVTVKSNAKTPVKVLYIKGEVVSSNSK